MMAPPLLFVVPAYAVLIVKGHVSGSPLRALDSPSALSYRARQNVRLKSRAKDGNLYSFELLRSYEPLARVSVLQAA